MAVVLNKRNIRVLITTCVLIVIGVFVFQNANASTYTSSKALKSTITDTNSIVQAHGEDENIPALKNVDNSPVSTEITSEEDSKINADSSIVQAEAEVPFDVAKEYTSILQRGPMVIFSKTFCPYSKALKELLSTNFQINPQPIVIELDKHEHGEELQAYIKEQTGRGTVPNLIINGNSKGGSDDMKKLFDENVLLDSLNEWSNGAYEVQATETASNKDATSV
ncbi:glutathione-disulfide reductase GRX7 NDAI_0G01800 [Naumovozyma dairenensis CBS 421]|uniref:Glutaredoxin domain-containing protein n=1 Tax=Naumovozyma dairenensis (strain ATCC 10597 / BCRC 20456 / CBS 421 / NBRC 0211 / NRRL Y-12639) TaxID=1071378 RepID=G0WDU5_NAUDC|nr:hypothetical protein NDAI_0G01800 [Naumovozyma dairenensis CBS 421]CCD25956.2 hypothetical protein NDAI_0G01800 [Naumovozyma dairenensis CBS 421]